jgi:hypothetical protein
MLRAYRRKLHVGASNAHTHGADRRSALWIAAQMGLPALASTTVAGGNEKTRANCDVVGGLGYLIYDSRLSVYDVEWHLILAAGVLVPC